MIKTLENNNYEDLLKGSRRLVIDFFANWCEPCKKVLPLLEKVEDKYDFEFVKVDVEKHRSFAIDNRVLGVPTIIVFIDGKEITRHKGIISLEQLTKWLDNV